MAEPCLALARALGTPWGEDLTSIWENPQLWGSLHPVGKGVHAHTHTYGHTLTPGRTWRLTDSHSRAHTAWGLGEQEDPPAFGPWEVPFPMSLFAGALPTPLGFPQEPAWLGVGTGPLAIPLFPLYRLSLPTRHPQTHFI